ncbi:MAG: DUF4093 domain-containing protein [Clostridia bacterium]|nr:DUF4093 domain-containing protein [Clostridia bacterium]
MEKIKISYPIIVEGRYDKIKLSSILDADIFTTDGFQIFKASEKTALFRALAKKSLIIVLTDSDGGGTVIRNRFKAIIPEDRLIHLYIPQIEGKESRKAKPSKAGTLGVEGMDAELLRGLFRPFADGSESKARGGITKTDFYELGLSGGDGSSEKRSALSARLGFPREITANALLSALNILYSREEFLEMMSKNC